MASLDKTSVRAEVSRLKTDFEQLCADGKITAESKAQMMSMFMIVGLILSIFLEKTTQKDNKNSNIAIWLENKSQFAQQMRPAKSVTAVKTALIKIWFIT